MKTRLITFLSICLLIFACGEDNDDIAVKTIPNSAVNFKLTHGFDDTLINVSNYTTLEHTNEFGTKLKIESIRYLISKIELKSDTGITYLMKDYNLLDLSKEETYTFDSDVQIPNGNYTLSLVWGFNEADNIDAQYADLNSASWSWPAMLGGGYHFLQFDGKYNTETASPSPFNFHNGTAKTSTGDFEQNFVAISLPNAIAINSNSTIELKMNIAELFKNPNTWDLNTLDTPLMPNYTAQKMMQANVVSVFSLGAVTAQ